MDIAEAARAPSRFFGPPRAPHSGVLNGLTYDVMRNTLTS